MKNMLKPLIFVLSSVLSGLVIADEMAVPVGQQGADQSVARPRSGLSMDQVSSKFGAPSEKLAPVGTPPITRWIYDAYTVYFENDRVIHSVLNAK